jgi:hypothetical protein
MMMSSARQQDNESLAEYYKRFTSCVDVGESQWGTPVPRAAATNETNEKMSRDKFITYVFFAGVDTKRYGKLKLAKDGREFRDNVVTLHEGQGNSYGRQMKIKDKHTRRVLCRSKNVTCYNCGKKGHYLNKCPSSGDSDDDELST